MIDSWGLMKNWDRIIPPSRPSLEQLNYLISFSKNLNKSDFVAVLGSTIEFRDLLYELGFEKIYVFERNKDYFARTSNSRIYRNKEFLILGDWTETIQSFKDCFVLILSDLTSGNVSYDNRKKFYIDIENALKKNGHFFDKVLKHESFYNVQSLLNKYKSHPINIISVNYFSCELLFCSELLKRNEKVETTKFYKYLEEVNENSRIKKFIEFCKLITPEDFEWYYGREWNILEMEYCQNLEKINELDDFRTSPYFKKAKLFHFIKRYNYEGV